MNKQYLSEGNNSMQRVFDLIAIQCIENKCSNNTATMRNVMIENKEVLYYLYMCERYRLGDLVGNIL